MARYERVVTTRNERPQGRVVSRAGEATPCAMCLCLTACGGVSCGEGYVLQALDGRARIPCYL